MSSKIMLLSLALTVLAVAVAESSFGSSGESEYHYELSGSALTQLYNSAVYLAERMKRPLGSRSWMWGPISHSGVRVTLANPRDKWLIHKGNNFGKSSQTVVVNARHMSSKWKVVKTANFKGTKKVADFVADGGSDYSLLINNCHKASRRMMKKRKH